MPFLIAPIKWPVITPKFEFRERYENRQNKDFDRNNPDDRHDYLSRVRAGLAVQFSKLWDAEAVYQMADNDPHPRPVGFVGTTRNASTAFVRYKQKDYTVTAGRFKLNIAGQRLYGSAEWGNVGRSIDGLRVQSGRWDVWAGALGVSPVRLRDVRLVTTTYTSQYGPTTLFYKHDEPTSGDVDHYTLDHVYKHNYGINAVTLEGAVQAGQVAGRRLEAWGLMARVDRPLNKQVTVYVEANTASGGGGKKGPVLTFDNLYPTDHVEYGIVDIQSWRNMNELSLGIKYKPHPRWALRGSVHDFSLRDATDAWYGNQSLINKRGSKSYLDKTGKSGRDIGREFDMEFSYTANPRTIYQGGVGIFDPGRFVNKLGGGDHVQVWAFASVSFKL